MKNRVKCQICGKEFKQITYCHLEKSHGITLDEYKKMYPEDDLTPNHKKQPHKKYKLICKNCGNVFYHEDKRTKYCSKECHSQGMSKLIKSLPKRSWSEEQKAKRRKPNIKNRRDLPMDEVTERYISGESACSIAKDFNTNSSTIIKHLNWNGIDTRSPNKRKDIDTVLPSMYLSGFSMREIAKMLDITHGTVRRHLLQLGIKLRGKPMGEYHHSWNPNGKFIKRVRKYLELQTNWQHTIFERDNYTCWICGKRGGDLEAHHVYPFVEIINDFLSTHSGSDAELFEEIKKYDKLLDTSLGITLCKKCHRDLHSKGGD